MNGRSIGEWITGFAGGSLALLLASCGESGARESTAASSTSTGVGGSGLATASGAAGSTVTSATSSGSGGSSGGSNADAAGEAGGTGGAGGGGLPIDAGPDALPLSTCGRWIVDKNQRRVKLAGVNWYGASDVKHVVGGLDKVPMARVVSTIRDLGFNTVRLPFSNAMINVTGPVAPADVAANLDLVGKTPLQVFDRVVEALTGAGLYVMLNNHTTHAMWCCGFDDDGLWYTRDYSEARWIEDWEMLAERYLSNPRVMGADLRNELRPARGPLLPILVNWGAGGTNDWAAAAKRAGDRVLAINPNLIVIVEGIDSADNLRGVRANPVVLATPQKLAYQSHQYSFFPSPPGDSSNPYSGMNAAQLKMASYDKWGYIMDPGQAFTAPVILGEFGSSNQSAWMSNLGAYMRELDMDYTYWPINGGPKASGESEPFGLLNDDWTTVRMDERLTMLQGLQKPTRGPGISPADACP